MDYKIAKVGAFESAEMFRKDPFVVLFNFLCSYVSTFCQLFFLCCRSGHLIFLFFGFYCYGGHIRSLDLTGALMVFSTRSHQL